MSDRRRGPMTEIARGVLLLAAFRREGLGLFGATTDSVMSSLAPWLALPATVALLAALRGEVIPVLTPVLALVDVLIAQVVVSEALARFWGRESAWGRYATALNWGQWAALPAIAGCSMLVAILLTVGVPTDGALVLGWLALGAYTLGLQGFVARHGLGVSVGRATAVVLLTNLVGAAILSVPALRYVTVGGPPPTPILAGVSAPPSE